MGRSALPRVGGRGYDRRVDEVGGVPEERDQGAPVGTSEAHEEVVNTLLDLQRRLRGEPVERDVDDWTGLPPRGRRRRERPRLPEGGVAVETGSGLGVIAAPDPGTQAPPADPVVALEERLVRLERDLDALLASIEELSRLRR